MNVQTYLSRINVLTRELEAYRADESFLERVGAEIGRTNKLARLAAEVSRLRAILRQHKINAPPAPKGLTDATLHLMTDQLKCPECERRRARREAGVEAAEPSLFGGAGS